MVSTSVKPPLLLASIGVDTVEIEILASIQTLPLTITVDISNSRLSLVTLTGLCGRPDKLAGVTNTVDETIVSVHEELDVSIAVNVQTSQVRASSI